MTFIITFFRKKRNDFAKIAALNAALFDQTLRFFLPGYRIHGSNHELTTGEEKKHEEGSTDNQEEERQTDDCTDNTEHAPSCLGWKNVGYCEPG